uniref:HTH psq-type domain-containing protein n=1 Tax=Acrobeloides nanus TaxID=290746 RepID=A0A914C394_9BILA
MEFFKTVTTPETIQAVEKAFTNKNMSIRRAAIGLGISVDTVHKILHKDQKFHPYTLQLLQELKQNDKEKRVNFAEEQLDFAEEQLDFIENDLDFIKNLFFCYEAHFHLHAG